jgi:hypothetical protein
MVIAYKAGNSPAFYYALGTALIFSYFFSIKMSSLARFLQYNKCKHYIFLVLIFPIFFV